MTVVLVGAVVVFAIGLAYLGYRLWQVDYDLKQLDQDYDRLRQEAKAVHEQHRQAVDGQLTTMQNQLAWAVPWVQFWAASQVAQSELARRRHEGRGMTTASAALAVDRLPVSASFRLRRAGRQVSGPASRSVWGRGE